MALPERRPTLYFDHNATTPIRPAALSAQAEVCVSLPGNPSSQHSPGRAARARLEESREELAALLGCRPTEIVFTSGGTESNRLALEGAFPRTCSSPGDAPLAVVSALEHPSVLEVHAELASTGRSRLERAPGRSTGQVDHGVLAAFLERLPRLVSLQHANGETGILQPVRQVADLLEALAPRVSKRPRPLLHVDAVQTFGKTQVRPEELGADLVAVSSHKVGGPRGVGALWVRAGTPWDPPGVGGPQERKLRPGTENLAGIVGFVEAAKVALSGLEEEAARVRALSARLLTQLDALGGAVVNGDEALRLPGTLNVAFPGISAELLAISLDLAGVCVSRGSACASGSREPSHVLLAMGLPPERVAGSIRISLGWTTREAEIDQLVEILRRVLGDLGGGRVAVPATRTGI